MYAITEACVSHADTSCVTVCPVDCIHPTKDDPGFAVARQLFIDSTRCIGCDACADVCPWGAPYPIDELPLRMASAVAINANHFNAPDPRT